MTPTIRRATIDDADFIAWTILMGQRGHLPRGWFDIALDRTEPECLAFARCLIVGTSRSLWQATQYWVAEVEGAVAAALCAMPVGEMRSTAKSAIAAGFQAFGLDESEQAAFGKRGAYISTCWTAGDDGNWLIEHVAVRPSRRGLGLAQALIAHALSEGRAAGFIRASIPFYIGNDAAERSYAKAGFRFAEEKRNPEFEALTGSPGFRRFECALDL